MDDVQQRPVKGRITKLITGYYDATGTAPTQYTAHIASNGADNTYVNTYLAFDSYKQNGL
jgi:hypothetical protein